MICAADHCGGEILREDRKGYMGDEAVHLRCDRRAKVPCGDCNMIHAGGCP